jgi:nucleotide-binding universal stress UspA family protein
MEVLKWFFRRSARQVPEAGVAEAGGVVLAPVGASPAGVRPRPGGHIMKVLIPVSPSPSSQFAVRHVVSRFMNDSTMEIHLLNVQPAFSRYLARFAGKSTLREYHRAESEKAMQACTRILDGFGVPYAVHMAVGDQAERIVETARRLHCGEIVMGTTRQNSLTRLVENSVTNRVLERTSVPVEVVAGGEMSVWERYGIPAAITALLALILAVAD